MLAIFLNNYFFTFGGMKTAFYSRNTFQSTSMSGEYLLLRSNKKMGPYSLQELIALPLKPYDLIWVEGKSAAWRYAGEIPELAPYAPSTEEQPYDRFYKKGGKQQSEVAESAPLSGQLTGATKSKSVGEDSAKSFGRAADDSIQENGIAARVVNPKTGKRVRVIIPGRAAKTEESKKEMVSNAGFEKETPGEAAQESFDARLQKVIEAKNKYQEEVQQGAVVPKETSRKTKQSSRKAIKKNEAEPVLETKYQGSLDDIKRDYQQWLEKKKSTAVVKRAWIFPVAASLLVIAGIAIGMRLNHMPAPEVEQSMVNAVPQGSDQPDTPDESEGEPTVQPERKAVPTRTVAKREAVPGNRKNVKTSPSSPARKATLSAASKKAGVPEPKKVVEPVVSRQEEYLEKPAPKMASRKETKASRIEDLVSVTGNYEPGPSRKGIGGVKLTAANHSDKQLRMVALDLRYYDSRNNVVQEERLYFKQLPPGGSRQLSAKGNAKAARVGYRVMLVSTEEGALYYASN